MKLSEKLRKLRIKKGESQQDVRNATGLGITTIRNYENDKLDRIPNLYQLKLLRDHYNVTYEYLLNEECDNIESQNVEVGKELGLTDKSIQYIKDIKECVLSKELNEIIEERYLHRILRPYKHMKMLYNCRLEILSFLLNLYTFSDYLSKTNKNKQEREKEDKLLTLFQIKIDEFYEFIRFDEFKEIDVVTIKPETIQECFDKVKECVHNKKKSDIEKSIINFNDVVFTFYEVFLKNEDYNKFRIQENIYEMFYRTTPTIYDSIQVYHYELKEYYKYQNYGAIFEDKDIRRMEEERKRSNNKKALIGKDLSI